MRKLLLSLSFVFSGAAAATVCSGDVTVDNLGQTRVESATLILDSETKGTYKGPHASVLLGETVPLSFSKTEQGWMMADMSTDGHGGEVNVFWYRNVSENEKEFLYLGSYGYKLHGMLTCQ